MRVKFKDLHTVYHKKWVIIYDIEWKNGDFDTCRVHGVYETENEGLDVLWPLLREKSAGLFKMITEEEEDEIGFIFVMAG
ncbi:MAG: hypothetical protein FWG65_09815 [Turicibacter sp.]|nr:hypothetical protein [Turicibacter sp.]